MLLDNSDLFQPADAICITTNGALTKGNLAVMGKGCALQASKMIPQLRRDLGNSLLTVGNKVACFDYGTGCYLVTFPVKPGTGLYMRADSVVAHMRNKFIRGQIIPGWACTAELGLIEASCKQLVELTDKMGWEVVRLPKPGCGAGELNWEDVEPILTKYLDDRFIVHYF